MSSPSVQAYCEAFEARADALPGPRLPWLSRLRRDAIGAFAERGFPTTRWEDWRATNVTPISERTFRVAEAVTATRSSGATLAALDDAHRLVFVDGHLATELSDSGSLPKGARLCGLAQALDAVPERLERVLGRSGEPKTDPFRALNTALFADGLFLELERGVELERPVHALFLSSGAETLASPRIVVALGEHSRASIVEQYAALDGGLYLTNAVTDVALERGAALRHVKLQNESTDAFHVAALAVDQQGGSQLDSYSIAVGGRLSRFDIHTRLGAEQSSCRLVGLYLGRDAQLVDHHTWVDHAAPLTTSRELYKGILDHRARGVFRGRVHVRPDAQKIDASQSNRNLMLSEEAAVHAQPQLEIYADDVKCSHGNAIGRLDENALFYLRSRGIPLETARSLLTYAFANEIVAELPIAALREDLERYLRGWLR
jgi:Fe-S cluster assembly protein SufD